MGQQGLFWTSGVEVNAYRMVAGKHIARLRYHGKVRVQFEDMHPEAPKIVPRVNIVN